MVSQRIWTKGRTAPALVTPVAGESILKPHFRGDALPLRTSLQPRAAADVCCLHNVMHFIGVTIPKMAPSTGGIGAPPNTRFDGPTLVYNPTASRSVQPFL